MTVASFEGRTPHIGDGCWVHPSAEILGQVVLGTRCWIGPGARLRGDYGSIVLGDCCAVADNAVVHARPGETCTIGRWVTLGHGCVVHNVASLGDYSVVGMNAVVSDWAQVGEWAVVAEGAVVRQRAVVPAGRIAAGVPARLLDRVVDEPYRAEWRRFKQIYVDLCARYADGYGR
ncbi:MAG: gamma carbonic anhydrase family protein [Acidobacteriota bacterium]|nr:gamma carbonic anhydrase family protein [Acidobacteriota bacterium]